MAGRLTGWRYALFISGFIGAVGLFSYPIIINPMMHPDYYKEYRERVQNK